MSTEPLDGSQGPRNEDEKIHEMTVGEIDPAIIVVREKKFVYTRDELFEIAKKAASKLRPVFLDPAVVPHSMLDPEKWNLERRKSDTPTENGFKSGEGPDNRRRSGDPRERIRKENDGIILSPQRRSFNTGCFVPANREPATTTNNGRPGGRTHSPLGGKGEGERHIGGREIPTGGGGGRRVGSGRIMRVNCDSEKGEGGDGDYFGNRGAPMRGMDRGEDKREDKYGERRMFGRDFNERENKDSGRRNTRYGERRRYSENREEIEPEWFSSGPISQNDTIELRGFDESDKPSTKKERNMKRLKEWVRKKSESQTSIVEETEGEKQRESTVLRSTPDVNKKSSTNEGNEGVGETKPNQPQQHNDHSLHFEDILKCDNIPGIFSNGIDGGGDQSTSRFSRWFRTSPQDKVQTSSRRSSMQEENSMIKDLLKDINEQSSIPISIQPPGDSDSYFAPISPAGSSMVKPGGQPVGGQSVNIMDMFQRGKQTGSGREFPARGAKPGPGKILSLDELEAKMRPDSVMQQPKVQKPDEGMTEAFKRLLAQASGQSTSQNGPMHKPQAMSLMEMLNHSQQQDEARLAAAAAINQHPLMGGNVAAVAQAAAAAAAMQQQHHHNDLTMKLQQAQAQMQKQQMDMLNKLINAAPAMRGASPLLGMDVQQSRELLNRPEAQAILQGLKRGEITTQNLYQQLANPALQPRHREMLLTIIKLHNAGSALQQAGNTLHAAAAMHQRIPSPRELQVHTQNILQRALIKKKLEEQTENYRKKQEMQRGVSPNPTTSGTINTPKSVSSPTPLAFTPTSVLRKMTADKDDGKENKADNAAKQMGRPVTGMRLQTQPVVLNQNWNQQFSNSMSKQVGRPIVKNNYQQPQTPDQFFSQVQAAQQQQQNQQRLFAAQQQQQQQQQQMLQQQQQQQRKPMMGQQNMGGMGQQNLGGLGQQNMGGMGQQNIGHQSAGMGQQNMNSMSQQYGQQSQYGAVSQQYQSSGNSYTQQLTQQQLRAQHQHRPANQNQAQPSSQPGQSQLTSREGSQQAASQQAAAGSSSAASGWPQTKPNQSEPQPTNNLSRWFSPDLLERARGGELPSTANLARQVMSLEEIERQAAPPVHN